MPLADQLELPRLDEYFGLWAILEAPFRAAVGRVQGMNMHLHVASYRATPKPPIVRSTVMYRASDTAVVQLEGALMKHRSSLGNTTSTIEPRRAIREAAADPNVLSIVLRIDSHGGTVAGTKDLADEVARAAKQKAVHAFIEDLGASAAYWVASQTTKVYSNATALVGSIGTYATIEDSSEQAEKLGVKVHVLRAGTFKGSGTWGTSVTPEKLADMQRIVDEMNEFLLAAVSAGRRLSMSTVRGLADGRVHVGEAAAKLKLTDGVRTFAEVLAELDEKTKAQRADKPAPADSGDPRPGVAPLGKQNTLPAHVVPAPQPQVQESQRCHSRRKIPSRRSTPRSPKQ